MFMYLVVGVCTKTKRVDRPIADINGPSTAFVLAPIGQHKDAGNAAAGDTAAVEDLVASLEAGFHVGHVDDSQAVDEIL